MKHADYAWAALVAGIVAYEVACPPGQLLSEAVDRYRIRYPVATNLAIAYLAAHLTRVIPRHIDPLTILAARTWRAR
jgi:hypothetical protein